MYLNRTLDPIKRDHRRREPRVHCKRTMVSSSSLLLLLGVEAVVQTVHLKD